MNEKMAQTLDAEGGGQYLQMVNDVVQNGGKEKLLNDLAVTKAMFSGENGELGEYDANVNRYKPL